MKPWWWIVAFLVFTWVGPFTLAALRSGKPPPKWLRNGVAQVAVVLAWVLFVGLGASYLFGRWP